MPLFRHSVLFACTLVAAGAACAPAGSFRPASALLPNNTDEIGFGTVFVGPRPYVDEPTAVVGQAWGTHALGPSVHLSVVSAFDADALAGGLSLALLPLRNSRAAAGIEFELGYAWAGVALPMAARTVGGTWLYASPRLGTWGDRLTPGRPFGIDVQVVDALSARAECQLSWASFDPNYRRIHYGLALAYQFDDSSK